MAAQDGLKEQLAEHAATIQQQLEQLQELNASIADLQGQLGELALIIGIWQPACAVSIALTQFC